MNDFAFTALMTDLWGADESDLWDAIAADVDAGLTDPTTLNADVSAAPGELAAAEQGRVTRWLPEGCDLVAVCAADPQTDREDRTAEEHDEATRDWNSTVEDTLPSRDAYRADHPFPIDDEEVQW
ncbi:hypothetical protein [Bacillus mobilis]